MPCATSNSSNGSAHSEESNAHSETSTIQYDHESFETFRLKVQTLCRTLWPDPKGRFEIERGPGGSYNRIITISICQQSFEGQTEVILRIPRFDGTRIDREITTLRYVRQFSGLPVAEVLAVELSAENPLGRPYVIQNRIPGISLQSVYPNLSHLQQESIAEQIGTVLATLLNITSPVAGLIEQSSELDKKSQSPVIDRRQPYGFVKLIRRLFVKVMKSTGATGKVLEAIPSHKYVVRPFDIKSPYDDSPATPPDAISSTTPANSVLPLLISQFQLWKAETLIPDPDDYSMAEHYDRLTTIATEMSHLKLLGDDAFTLCHMDFAPRNILVLINDADSSISVSGILDWDSAFFAPKIMSCAPPSWLWAWVEDESEDEATAGEEPTALNAQKVKQTFEKAVGENFLRHCYESSHRMARRIIRLAIYGMHSNEDLKEAEKLFDEWAETKGAMEVASAKVVSQ